MLYLPGFITILYTYIAVKKTDYQDNNKPADALLRNVFQNLLITEAMYFMAAFYDLFYYEGSFSFTNLVMFYLAQDVYFYAVHKFLFHGPLWFMHKIHHEYITSVAAWYAHCIDHILLNLGSIAVPFYIFRNPSWVFFMLIIQQIYTSVNGHVKNSPHSTHHLRTNMRYGSIYLIDRIAGSF